ncbi:MAG: VirB4 family type IV secretion system protein [Dysgonomonas sp.]
MNTKVFLEEINPIGFIDNTIIGKSGTLSLLFRVEETPCYSIDKDTFEDIHQIYFNAFSRFKNHVIVHKQDIYVRKKYDGKQITGDSFISQAEQKHFDGRDYLEHTCYISFSLTNIEGLEESYLRNPFSYKSDIDQRSMEQLNSFLEDVKTVTTQLQQIQKLVITELSKDEVLSYIFQYRNGFYFDSIRNDLKVSDYITDGSKKGVFFCIDEAECLPDSISTEREDTSLLKGNNQLFCSYLETLGVELPYTHIVNQIWKFSEVFKVDFSLKVKQFGQHREFEKDIKRQYELLNDLETELSNEKNIICKYAFNVFLWEESRLFEKAEEKIKSELRLRDIKAYIPKYNSLYNVFLGSLIGNENKLDEDYFFLSDMQSSLALMVHTSTFKDDDKGVRFNERLNLRPFVVDLWNSPQGNTIAARNGIIIASTGGGKSVLALNIAQQYVEQGYKVVIVEFGSSFKQLTQLYPDKGLHIDYDKNTPLGINPFFVPNDEEPDSDKIITLSHFILKFMRDKELKDDAKQEVSLKSLLTAYYKTTGEKNFKTFYKWIEANKEDIFFLYGIRKEFFDVDTFLHVCKDFLDGGSYENVVKENEFSQQIFEKDLIVFELTRIKNDKFLVSVVVSIIMDVIQTKLLDRSSKGLLLFDEYAEVQTVKDDFSGDDMHANVAFCYQKIRKENGSVFTVLQTPDQLRDDEFSRGIISNTQLLFVLPTTETVYDAVIRKFNIKTQSHINLMKSLQNNFKSGEKYSEVFLRILDKDAIVLRLNLSPEKFLAFQTDGDTWSKLQLQAKDKGIEQAIKDKINETKDL